MKLTKQILSLVPIVALFLAPSLHAQEKPVDLKEVKAAISQQVPPFLLKSVKPSPIAGLYEVVEGNNVAYYSADGKYKVVGNLLDMENRVNITQNAKDALFKATFEKAFASVGKDTFITFPAKGEKKGHLNVFTDVDCFYCQKLHKEVPELNNLGVEVRYYFYPRAGLNSRSAHALESVWCSDDRRAALTAAKSRKPVVPKSCDNPIEQHMGLAEELGLRGTPFIITDSGHKINGYAPAKHLLQEILDNK